jgi:hypothetical protein
MGFEIKELYPALQAAYHSLTPVYEPALLSASESAGLTPSEVSILLAVLTFEPIPISAQLLNIRSPYTSPAYYHNILIKLKEKGMLESIGDKQFHITSLGLTSIKTILKSAYNAMSSIQPLLVIDLMDFASRLKESSDVCYKASEPPGKWCIQHARKLDPGTGSPVMVRIDQFLTELCAYRDDAHLAAWQSYEENGHAWDILTLLWLENSLPIESINEKLKRRVNRIEDSRVAIEQLSKKGWIISKNDSFEITPFAGEIRKIVEETTDRYYYAPLKFINQNELEQFLQFLKDFRKGLPSYAEND